ncbi:MAG: MBL fold metallo-hydrolase [Acidobacteria bacterium]|nr:MBL fold metallo-hydrolase [Acidobacteriota bacterium]
MPNYICTTCGVQYGISESPPDACLICQDERQYVNWHGQQWTTLGELRHDFSNSVRPEGPGITGIGTDPAFAIGQRALLVETPAGNVLWDCISLIDSATVSAVQARGGLSAIAISHPHYYSSMVEWSRAFGSIPIYLHEADRQWVMHHDPAIAFWNGDTHVIGPGLTLVRCGGHFPGGTVLHWAAGAGGRGVLLSGDIVMVAGDRHWASFMYSYPNYIPLGPDAVRHIVEALEPHPFEQLYGAWWERNILRDAKDAVRRSARRYLAAIGASKWYSSISTP